MVSFAHGLSPARVLALLLVVLAASPAAAANGSIRCRGSDSAGRRVDGTCLAVQGSARGNCVTAGGTCTIDNLAPGDYTVTLTTRSGRSSPSRSVHVGSGSTVTVVLTAETTAAVTYEHQGGTVVAAVVTGGDAGTPETGTADAGTRTDTSAASDAGTVATTGGSGGTTAGADGGTVVATDASRTDTTTVAAAVSAGTPTTNSTPPDRSTGTTLAVQGRTSDSRGRAVDGTVTVSRGGTPVGRATTSGGRYTLYDLPSGSLTLTFRSLSGAAATASTTYSGSAVTVNLSIP